jgi:glycerophosphoryl diester phosphodiesterase
LKRVLLVVLIVLAVAGAAAWVLRAPEVEAPGYLGSPPPRVIAHRGASGHAPGNTLEAFRLAVEMGADILEMDLQLTADGRVVVIHDDTVDGTTDGSGAVSDLTLAEVKALDAGYRFERPAGEFPFRGAGVVIPTLEEVLEAFAGTPLNLEMKTPAGPRIAEALAGVLRRHRAEDRVLVASFSAEILERFRELMPGVATSLAESEVRTLYVLHRAFLDRWYRSPGVAVQVPERSGGLHVVTPSFLAAARRLGLQVHVWTINDPADMRRLVDLGVDGIITDYPDRLAAVLRR